MQRLRFAVLGTGFWSHYQIPAWFEVGGVELAFNGVGTATLDYEVQ
jgi:hypothetical protein